MTTSSVSTSSSAAPLVVNGLISGINTTAVIQALLQAYQAPITDLQNQQSTLNTNASDYGTINTDLQSLLTAAQALSTSSSWNLMTASSSDSAVATATSSPGAQAGTASFTVDQLAQGDVLASTGSVSSTGEIVTSASSLLVGVGGAALGFSGLAASGSLALGAHTIEVTQSSSAGTVTGSSTLPASTTITTGSNDTLDLTVNGTAYTLTLAASPSGGYTPAGLVSAIDSAAQAAGAGVSASLTPSGALELSTTEQGSGASLSVTGGDALSTLGLSSGQSGTGTDAVVTVDGTSTTLSAITPGEQVSLAAPSGSITATIASSPAASGSLVSTGSASAALVSTGGGTLEDVVQAINASGLAATATAVQDAQGGYLLQVSANSTGLAGSVSVDSTDFSGGPLVGLTAITQAQDALVTVGGAGGYELSSATDTFSNILSGTAVTVASTGQATVSVTRDAAGEASKVSSLVSAANQVLSDIQKYAGYDEATKTGGPLMGSSVLENIKQSILSMFASSGGTSSYGNALAAGITLNSDGTLSFDQSTFESAFQSDPSQVEGLFTAGGTFSPSSPSYAGDVAFVYAGNGTLPGSYDVQISQSATQATDTGSTLSSGTVSASETLSVTAGGQTATYTTTAGESLSQIASGLNQQFGADGLALTASVVGGGTQLELQTSAYGSAASFQVSSTNTASGTTGLAGGTANTPTTYTGSDVQGTIDGVAATGSGQFLSAPTSDPTLAGLTLQVTATGISSTTDLGTFTYTPGLAQQLQTLASEASDPTTGWVTTAINSLTAESQGLNGQIANYQQLESSQQTLLQNEFAKMEATLGQLKSESSALSSQIAQLP